MKEYAGNDGGMENEFLEGADQEGSYDDDEFEEASKLR